MAKKQKPGAKKTSKATSKEDGLAKEPFCTLFTGNSEVTALAFAPDGRTLLSGSANGDVRLWDLQEREGAEPVKDRRACWVLGGDHAWRVVAVPFSPDGKMVAIVWQGVKGEAQGQTVVKLLDLITRESHGISVDEESPLRFPCFSAEGNLLALTAQSMWLFDRYTWKVVNNLTDEKKAYSMALSPKGRRLALGGVSGEIRLWKIRKKQNTTLRGHKGLVSHLAFSPDGKVLASASTTWPPQGADPRIMSLHPDHTVRLWDTASGEQTGDEVEVGDVTACLEILADGQTWVSVDVAGDEVIVHRGGISSPGVTSLTLSWGGVCSAAVSRDGDLVALGDENGAVTLWKQDAAPAPGRGAPA